MKPPTRPPKLKPLTERRYSARPLRYLYTSLDGALNNSLPVPSIATILPLAFLTKARSSLNPVTI